jgi:ABC-type Fe3+ transport system permease subunit
MMASMDARRIRDQQKRRAWRQGLIAALVVLVLLFCVVPLLWIIPVFEDNGGDSGVRPGIATPLTVDQQSPTP